MTTLIFWFKNTTVYCFYLNFPQSKPNCIFTSRHQDKVTKVMFPIKKISKLKKKRTLRLIASKLPVMTLGHAPLLLLIFSIQRDREIALSTCSFRQCFVVFRYWLKHDLVTQFIFCCNTLGITYFNY